MIVQQTQNVCKDAKIEKIEILRSGNLLSISNGKVLAPILDKCLSYSHKTFYNGRELFERKKLKRENPASMIRPEFDVSTRKLYQCDDDRIYCSAGLKHRVVSMLKYIGIPYEVKDLRTNKLPPADLSALLHIPNLSFRYKQDEVIAMIDAADGGVISAPTAFGKTFIATILCRIYPYSHIAFVSPGVDLIRSTYKRLLEVVPGQVGRIGDGHYEPDNRILLCSADSLHKLPMGKLHLIMYDEVHTAATGKRSEMLCAQYTDAKFIGFSASVNSRADGADAIVESIFGPVLMHVDYADAAAQGSVANINVQFLEVPKGPFTPVLKGDTVQNKRQGYWLNNYRNKLIADKCNNLPNELSVSDPQVLIMVETVEHIFQLRHHLPDYEVVYAGMTDKIREKLLEQGLISEDEEMTDQRRQWLLDEFQKGNLKKVIANHCWKQGIDPVHLNVFFRADGGTSEINNIQLPGRLSRITDSKNEGLLIDCWDSFDEWTLRRSKKRLKAYQKLGFKVLPR